MQMMQTDNERIIAMGYENKTMRLQFSDGSLYEYDNVPAEVFNQFWNAHPKSPFFSTHIRGHYAYKRL